MSEPVSLERALYFELRTALLEHQLLQQQAQRSVEKSAERLNGLMAKAGLDPGSKYRLSDADLSATAEA